jgi:acyl-CoA synthetase (AMP-forming)/AMP-acid ligase II
MRICAEITSLNFKQLYFRDIRFDKQLVEDAIDHLAKYLARHTRSDSPFVLLASYNHIKTLIAYYAIMKAGRIPAILDPRSKSIELTEIIEEIDPAAILFLNSNEITFRYEEEIVFRKQTPGFIIRSDLRDVCTLAFTNAEDGYSKGAMITEQNLFSEIQALIVSNRLNSNSVTCALLPFSHLYGLVQGILIPTHAGSTGVIADIDILRINELVNTIRQYQITHLYTVPSLYYLFSKVPGIENAVQSVKEFYSGGTQLTPFIFESFYKKTNRKIREGYGLTESSPGVALDFSGEEPVEDSIGRALPGCEIQIMDEDHHACLPGHIGEICVKGDMVFKGYFNHDETTKAVLKDGWLHTGDYGRKDIQGNIFFCGLKKDMINVAGHNVYPRKLERMIKFNKLVREVNVFREDSLIQGHVVGATIRLLDNSIKMQEELRNWCYDNINRTVLPKIWQFE